GRVPAALGVISKLPVPPTRVALAGRLALASEEVIPIVSVTFVIRFQLASTALTVTVNAAPAVCGVGVPVLPLAVLGAAVSPGTRIWSLVNGPTSTGIAALVLAVTPACVASEAVTVAVPGVCNVTLRVL